MTRDRILPAWSRVIILPRSRSLLPSPEIELHTCEEKKKPYTPTKPATSAHHSLSFIHSSRLRPFPSPTRLHLHRWTAFCGSPHWQFCSSDLPITVNHLFSGPLSVRLYVKPLTAFLNQDRCAGLLWMGKSCLIPSGVIFSVNCITRPPYALRFALLSASSLPFTPEWPLTHISVLPARAAFCICSSIHDLAGSV